MLESFRFRRYAQMNCVRFRNLRIYSPEFDANDTAYLANYQTSESNSSLAKIIAQFGSIGTDIDRYQTGNELRVRKQYPTITAGSVQSSSMSITGTIYSLNKTDYENNLKEINKVISAYKFRNDNGGYSGRASLTGQNPIDAATRGMVIGNLSNMQDLATITKAAFTQINTSQESQAQNELIIDVASADARLGQVTRPFMYGASEFVRNLPNNIVSNWLTGEGGTRIVEFLVNGKVAASTKTKFVATSLKYTLTDQVVDNSGTYFSAIKIDLSLSNPVGGFTY